MPRSFSSVSATPTQPLRHLTIQHCQRSDQWWSTAEAWNQPPLIGQVQFLTGCSHIIMVLSTLLIFYCYPIIFIEYHHAPQKTVCSSSNYVFWGLKLIYVYMSLLCAIAEFNTWEVLAGAELGVSKAKRLPHFIIPRYILYTLYVPFSNLKRRHSHFD